MKVLIIDDDMIQRMLLTRVLGQRGYGPIIEAEDGEEGIQAFKQHDDIDLIITDFHLPMASGIEVISRLRRMDWETPMYLVTGEECEEVRRAAEKAGANAMLVKPLTYEGFVSKFTDLVESLSHTPQHMPA